MATGLAPSTVPTALTSGWVPGIVVIAARPLRMHFRSAARSRPAVGWEAPAQARCPSVNYCAYMVLPWATVGGGVRIPVGYRPPMVIDRAWDEPVYQQVAGILRDQITSGKIEPRRPIPSIRTLCETYGIARATAGKAIRLLSDEGLIRRVPGKGWFVSPRDDWPSSR